MAWLPGWLVRCHLPAVETFTYLDMVVLANPIEEMRNIEEVGFVLMGGPVVRNE